jgi:hypothetical protein
MIDEKHDIFLLEVNAKPTMKVSTEAHSKVLPLITKDFL